MKLLTAVGSAAFSMLPCGAMFVHKDPQAGPQAARSALLKTSSELQQTIVGGFTGDPVALLKISSELQQTIGGLTVDPAGDLLGSVATMITDTMMPGIISAHNSTQHQLVAFGDAFSSCRDPQVSDDSSTTTATTTVFWARGSDYDELRGDTSAWCPHDESMNEPAPAALYRGCQTRTKYGAKCDTWVHIHMKSYQNEMMHEGFPRDPLSMHKTVVDLGAGWFDTDNSKNYCRDPYGDGFLWCYIKQGAEHSHCNPIQAPATTTTTTTVLGGPQWIAAKMEALAQCRQKESEAAIKNQDCHKAMSILEGVKNSTCNSLKVLETVPLAPHLCEPTVPYEQWLISVNETTHALKDSFAEKKFGCGNATKLYDDKVPDCGAAKSQHDGNKTECDRLQAQAEAGICSGPAAAQQEICEDYSTCYDNALLAYQGQEPTIKAMHLNWTVQWRTLKRMDCLLGVMQAGGTNDDVDKCKEKRWSTDHLDLIYPAIPEKKQCPGKAGGAAGTPLPCESDFLTKHYSSNPPLAPAADCTPCFGTTPSPVAVQCMCGSFTAPTRAVLDFKPGDMNHYTCDDGSKDECLANEQCMGSQGALDPWPKAERDDACSITCNCHNPGLQDGSYMMNSYSCTDGSQGACAVDQLCGYKPNPGHGPAGWKGPWAKVVSGYALSITYACHLPDQMR